MLAPARRRDGEPCDEGDLGIELARAERDERGDPRLVVDEKVPVPHRTPPRIDSTVRMSAIGEKGFVK